MLSGTSPRQGNYTQRARVNVPTRTELLLRIRREEVSALQKVTDAGLRCEIRYDIDPTGVSVAYLVLVVDGKSLPYMRIPDSMSDNVVARIVAKLNT